jgi:uncharacterized protein (UPF0276 family)
MELTAGVGLKPQHFDAALESTVPGLWLEVHAENYMVAGGPRLDWLAAIRARHPISLHGVGMSLASDDAPDSLHLERLAALARSIEPALISEHLAWSRWNGMHFPDLLPFPRTDAALQRICVNVEWVQDALQRPIAVENPAHYLKFEEHTWDEIAFLRTLARRTGCRLLLDVNNVYVGAHNLGYSAQAYIDAFPGELVAEVHLAGHTADPNLGAALLVDSHDAPIAPGVWSLYQRLIARIGPRPTLIERDGNLPAFAALLAERDHAAGLLGEIAGARA